MDIFSASNASFSRFVTPSKSSSDRQSNDQTQPVLVEHKAQARAAQQHAVQEKLQDQKEANQHRLNGRIISFGHEQDNVSREQKQASFNRSRVNEAYSAPFQNEITDSQNERAELARNRNHATVDIVV